MDDDFMAFFDMELPVAPEIPVTPLPLPSVGKSASSSTAKPDDVTFTSGKKADIINKLRKSQNGKEDGPSRPKSAYMLYQRELILDGFKGSVRQIAAKWRLVSAEDRVKYEDLATAERARYQTEVKKYFGDRGQDLMSILVECATDSASKKRKVDDDRGDPKPAPKRMDDAFGDLFDADDAPSNPVLNAEIAAPQLRLDASGRIIVDAASLEAGRSHAGVGAAMRANNAKPYDHAYKRTKRATWSEEENDRFWSAVSVYGTDHLLIQTLIKDKTSAQIKAKFKHEEKRNRPKLDAYIYGESRKKFTKDLFEEQFGKIDASKHFVPVGDVVVAEPVIEEDKNAGFDALLDLFD